MAAPSAAPPSAAAALSPPPKLCAFCGADAAAYGGHLGRMQGPFYAPGKRHDAVYVHHECALWSPQITVDALNRLQSVMREVRRARNLKCSVCDKPGAALGCRVPSCQRCFHLPCAIEQGCWFNFELYLMSCKEHSALFKKEPAGRQGRAVAGPLKHLKLSSRHLLSGLPKVFAGHEAAAAAAAVLGNNSAAAGKRPRSAPGSRRRNRMSADELGNHMAAAEEAYLKLVDELGRAEESEDDEAVFARKNLKRMRKADQLLAPTLLQPPAPAPQQQQQQQRQPGPHHTQMLPPGAQHRYLQHLQHTREARQEQQEREQQEREQQQQPGSWQPSSEGFKGVGGLEDAKRQLKEMVLMPLTYPQLYSSLGIQPPRGILLHGPAGTGKTSCVRALAAECAALAAAQPDGTNSSSSSRNGVTAKPVALFARKGTDCLGKYAGDAELHLRMLFEKAAAAAPSIIFLDELDGLVPARSVRSGGSDQIFASIVSVLLALMDGLTDRGQVLVIGATNRPDNIDPALRRPGRFDREVFVGLPGAQHRADILAVHTAKWRPAPTPQLLQQMVAQTEGWAGADLQALAASALMAAVRRVTPQVLSSLEAERQTQQQPQVHMQQQQQQHQAGQVLPAAAAATEPQDRAQPAVAAAGSDGLDVGQQHSSSSDTPAASLDAAAAAVSGVMSADGDLRPAPAAAAAEQEQQQAMQDGPGQLTSIQAAAAALTPPLSSVPPADSAHLSQPAAGGSAATTEAPAAAAAGACVQEAGGASVQGGFLSALQDFVTEKPGAHGFWFSPPRPMQQEQPQQQDVEMEQQQQQEDLQRPIQPQAQQQEQQQEQQGPNHQQQHEQTQKMQQHKQQNTHQRTVSPAPPLPPQPRGGGGAASRPPRQPQRQRSGGGDGGSGGGRSSTSRSPPAAPRLPQALGILQVLPCDWSTALAELGPPASKRGSHNLPALSPAGALPWPLGPLLLPALGCVVDVLQDWLLLGPADVAAWRQVITAPNGGGDCGASSGSGGAVRRPAVGAAGAGAAEGAPLAAMEALLLSWGVVEAPPPSRRAGVSISCDGCDAAVSAAGDTTDGGGGGGAALTAAAAVQGAPPATSSLAAAAQHAGMMGCLPGAPTGLPASSSLLLQGYTTSRGSSSTSSTPHCLLLCGHGAEGQSELAAACVKLLDSRAGAAVYTLSLPVMLLLGGGAASTGLVAGVQEALGRTSTAQPLVLYMPRIELWSLEASKPRRGRRRGQAGAVAAAAVQQRAAAAKACPARGRPHSRHTVGRWCSGLQGAFSSSSDSSSSDDEPGLDDIDSGGSGSEPTGRQGRQHDANNNNNNDSNQPSGFQVRHTESAAAAGAAARPGLAAYGIERDRQEVEQCGQLRLSAAWSTFEQQLAVLNRQRQLLVLATSHLPVDQLPAEIQQLFGWEGAAAVRAPGPQRQQQQQQAGLSPQPLSAMGAAAYGVSGAQHSGRRMQFRSSSSSRTVQVCGHAPAGECLSCSGDMQSALGRAVAVTSCRVEANAAAPGPARDTSSRQAPPQESQPSTLQAEQPAAVDALIAAAVREKGKRWAQPGLPSDTPVHQPGASAVQQWGAALQQLNAAQQAEARALLEQVQAVLQHVASTVLQDPRLSLTRTKQQQQGSGTMQSSTRRRSAASILCANKGTTQQVLAAAAGLAPTAVCELEGSLPLAAVCIKALRGFFWGLDAFQAAFTAAVDAVRQHKQASATGYSCAAAAATLLQDSVCTACHEARCRLRLYDHSRMQLLEAAALARLCSVQQQLQ